MDAPCTGKKNLARFSAWVITIEVRQARSHPAYNLQRCAMDVRDILRRESINIFQMLMVLDESHSMETDF